MKSISFDNAENLGLKTFSFEKETISSESDIIRNLKDENGRIMKLLQEKDFEINKIKRTFEKQNIIKDNLSEGAASLKIIELSKKLREASSECESWKTKYYQRDKEAKSIVNEVRERKSDEPVNESLDVSELKSVKEKLKTSENKVLELLTSNQTLSRDLKMATKVLENELGDSNVDITRLLANPGQWRGRAQKIVSLKDKIENLERQLKDDIRPSGRNTGSGATSLGMSHASSTSVLTRQGDVLARMQRDRQMSADKVEEERRRLTAECERLKQVCEGLKSRNKCLTDESKSYKQQIKNMLDKTKNDDELIGSLIQQQDRLKNTLQSLMNGQQSSEVNIVCERSQSKQDRDTAEKLREIVAAKDGEILRLRESEGARVLASGECKEEAAFNVDFEETKIRAVALETEVTQLRSLVLSEERRLEEVVQRSVDLAEENSRLRQNYLQIERELQKVAPNHKSKSKLKLMPSSEAVSESGLLSRDAPVTRETIESLQEEVSLRADKAESLKSALELLSSAKQDDLRMLTDIIDQTRQQFLDSVKKIRAHCSNKEM